MTQVASPWDSSDFSSVTFPAHRMAGGSPKCLRTQALQPNSLTLSTRYKPASPQRQEEGPPQSRIKCHKRQCLADAALLPACSGPSRRYPRPTPAHPAHHHRPCPGFPSPFPAVISKPSVHTSLAHHSALIPVASSTEAPVPLSTAVCISCTLLPSTPGTRPC